ncbi:MT-A70-domain-containing protein [Lophiotrema nucula]|uniref:MT-A70-domain-containing protein n=1 Tax=Lophiotrema nucula TaxID=690887 RepID=A0A6A5ZQZ9_9PLEO|nr:MT-A70-domain-containing protein [Lophiotrema nucula]
MNPDEVSLRTSILYQNDDRDITLMDLPTSIAVGQKVTAGDILLSTPPIESPYLIASDPKTKKAQERHAEPAVSNKLHAEYRVEIDRALAEIRRRVPAPWCLPRKLMAHVPESRNTNMDVDDPEKELETRLREWSASKGDDEPFDFNKMMAALGSSSDATSCDPVAQKWSMSCTPAREITEGLGEDSVSPTEAWTSSLHNPNDHALELNISQSFTHPEGIREYRFRVPPRSTFFLDDVTDPSSFRASFRDLTSEYNLPRHFDFVLLDPPWPSRSAKRVRTYEQVGGIPHTKRMLLNMSIESYLEHNSILAMWITNSPKQRDAVLGPGGLFERWNLSFCEEWIWIKTTASGEPMFSLETLWRKPYETLLLARAAPDTWTKMEPAPAIKRRIIAAVPDIHSRKPCIKELIEPFLPHDYSALEVFSRSLVAGWTSWGNEAIKYNWEKYWASGATEPELSHG